ncbi:ubiquitin carboxyl-terminal hydrolase 17-like [Bubalus kerabau]|uniref:ubiquitin carboxyl-terminal hydrolase 17-like n=1 Tax=Bubalus carabanensis TaxID=3119969 RepID=UPI00244EED4F|nr:ubiquitin carboxyl-terminal hydrolase 17-like [Bubalus carabanensis]
MFSGTAPRRRGNVNSGREEELNGAQASGRRWELLQSRLPAPGQDATAGAFTASSCHCWVELLPGMSGGVQKSKALGTWRRQRAAAGRRWKLPWALCAEPQGLLLSTREQGCSSASQPSGHASEDTTVIRQIFGGTWRSQIQCLHCLGVSDTFDPYLDISLDIMVAQSVEQALSELVKPEKLDADNAYDCGICLRKVPATKRLTLHSTSQVLVLVLKRFTPVSGAKRAQEVRYPQCLDVQPYTSEQKAGPLGYVLYAVLVHSGWSCERGHYFCYVRAGNGQWYKMDDAKVTACDETTALSQSAYVLFYSWEGVWEGGPGGGPAAPVGADPTDPGQPAGDASGRAAGSEESLGDTEVEGMSFEQWRRLQEHNRPKPALELRKVQSALPAGAVMIHQSKHGGGRNRTLPQQEHELLDRPSTETPPPGPTNIINGPCAISSSWAPDKRLWTRGDAVGLESAWGGGEAVLPELLLDCLMSL